MYYTTNLIKQQWYEPLYNEVLQVCDYMMEYKPSFPEEQKFLTGEDLSIGNNTTVFISVSTKHMDEHYRHISVHSTYPTALRYILLQTIKENTVEFIIDKNHMLHNGIEYGKYWYDEWKSSKAPMWVDLHSLRRYIEDELIDQYGSEYICEMDLEEYIKLETNRLLMLPREKKYNPLYDEKSILFNIRNTEYEKYHPMSFPISDL